MLDNENTNQYHPDNLVISAKELHTRQISLPIIKKPVTHAVYGSMFILFETCFTQRTICFDD
jgi:hypothetical protein